ncbi:MAG: elongation factor P [Dehalococcoidia bacterium]|nr:elongation factor P [Dehalococcoidia bacterium]
MIGVGDLKRGITVELDGEPYQVVEYTQQKMQQRAPVLHLKLRHLRTGRLVERTFSAYHLHLPLAEVDHRSAQYIYSDGDLYYFMDSESFEQFPISREKLGDVLNYLKEQTQVSLLFYKGAALTVELPITVDLKVAEAPPAFRGDTAQGGNKPATLETGLVVQVPLFVAVGDVVRVDTRNGEYLTRVS